MKSPAVRAATAADLPAIRTLVRTVLEEFGFSYEPTGADADLHDEACHYFSPGGRLEVLSGGDGAIAGVLGMVTLEDRALELRKLYLARRARGAGRGRALLQRAIAFASQTGCARIHVETHSRLRAALSLYEAAGFRRTAAARRSATCDVALTLDLTGKRSG